MPPGTPISHPLSSGLRPSHPHRCCAGVVASCPAQFLVNRDGAPVKRYSSKTTPNAIEGDIVQLLGPETSADEKK